MLGHRLLSRSLVRPLVTCPCARVRLHPTLNPHVRTFATFGRKKTIPPHLVTSTAGTGTAANSSKPTSTNANHKTSTSTSDSTGSSSKSPPPDEEYNPYSPWNVLKLAFRKRYLPYFIIIVIGQIVYLVVREEEEKEEDGPGDPSHSPQQMHHDALAILGAAIAAVDPRVLVSHACHRQNNTLVMSGLEEKKHVLPIARHDLTQYDNIIVVGAGKAAVPMALQIEQILGSRITSGLIITKDGHYKPDLGPQHTLQKIRVSEASHPIPDQRSVTATQELITLLQTYASPRTLVINLISGGASALLTAPAAGLTLSDLSCTTSALLACGASIDEINTIRKHLSAIAGGRMCEYVGPSKMTTLVLSDVIGNPLDLIASGPTVPDTSTFTDCMNIIKKYRLDASGGWLKTSSPPALPSSVINYIQRGINDPSLETPKPHGVTRSKHRISYASYDTFLIGSNAVALSAAQHVAKHHGYRVMTLTDSIQGESSSVAQVYAAITKSIQSQGQPIATPACVLVGGETTITLTGIDKDSKGGRNQELALAAAIALKDVDRVAMAAVGTDGEDGPTPAAGALITGNTVPHAISLGLDPQSYLTRHDSYHFFHAYDHREQAEFDEMMKNRVDVTPSHHFDPTQPTPTGPTRPLPSHIITGPTGTNVMDLHVILVAHDRPIKAAKSWLDWWPEPIYAGGKTRKEKERND